MKKELLFLVLSFGFVAVGFSNAPTVKPECPELTCGINSEYTNDYDEDGLVDDPDCPVNRETGLPPTTKCECEYIFKSQSDCGNGEETTWSGPNGTLTPYGAQQSQLCCNHLP
ncbi:MAG: hypothetical protein ACKVQC_05410 [Elusimicrobiota bacterium]